MFKKKIFILITYKSESRYGSWTCTAKYTIFTKRATVVNEAKERFTKQNPDVAITSITII